MATIAANAEARAPVVEASPRRGRSLWKRNSALVVGAVLVAFVAFVAVFGPLLAPYNPTKNDYAVAVQPPSIAHPFGTDKFGRDQLSRVIAGTRIDLSIGILCTAIPAIVGV